MLAAALLLALSVSAEPTRSSFVARAGVSGCTCFGQSAAGSSEPLFYGSSVNGVGWCFADGVLRPEWVTHVNDALTSGSPVATEWLNTPVALDECAENGIDLADCADYLISGFTSSILSSSGESTQYIAQCTRLAQMDPESYTQTDCQCSWVCNAPWERCGDDGCMDPYSQQCASGKISDSIQITRRRACPAGQEVCRSARSAGWECLDTSSDIEACGACPNTPAAVDCTALGGVSAVACRTGQCVVEACQRGYRLANNECAKIGAARI